MKFGKTPLKEAQGAILAHSMRFGDLALAKGRKLNRADINALRAAGIDEVTAARLGINDVGEDAAAAGMVSVVPTASAFGFWMTPRFAS